MQITYLVIFILEKVTVIGVIQMMLKFTIGSIIIVMKHHNVKKTIFVGGKKECE